jgi:hypothetical protein
VILRAVLALGLAAVFVPAAAPLGTASYSGSIRFRGAEPSNVTLVAGRGTATVTLGPGHVAHAEVKLRHKGNTLRFFAPGLPKPMVFRLTSKGTKLSSTATQGTVARASTSTSSTFASRAARRRSRGR